MTWVPTRRLALLLAAGAPLWLASGTRAGLVLASLATLALVALVIVDVTRLPGIGALELDRAVPSSLGMSDEADAEYVVRSRAVIPLHVVVEDAMPAARIARLGGSLAVELQPGAEARLPFIVRTMARGETILGDTALRVTTRLGLLARLLRFPQDDRVVVAPSLAGVKRFRWLAVHQRLAAAGVRDARRRGEGQSFARLRDYNPGDDPRHIDWKATARRGRPISREFTVEQSQTVFVLVDAGRSMTQRAGELARFEYALSAALVLADTAVAAGDRVGAMVFDDRVRALVPAQRGTTAVGALRAALVPVQPTMAEPDYAGAFRVLAQHQRKRALLVLVTDVLEERAARALLAHLTRGAQRHLAVVVALRNEALVTASAIPEGDAPGALYTSAAAAELLAERATALQRMRDAGVVVLDVAPDAMAAAIVGQYLEIKARGSL